MLRAAEAAHAVDGSHADEGGEGEEARQALPLPDVEEPAAAEVARHSLTHLPYRRWCRWCGMARKANMQHRALPPVSREIPPLVLDY